MTTIINPSNGGDNGSGANALWGVLIAIILIILFFVYGLPAIRGADTDNTPDTINVDVNPGAGTGIPTPGPDAGTGTQQ